MSISWLSHHILYYLFLLLYIYRHKHETRTNAFKSKDNFVLPLLTCSSSNNIWLLKFDLWKMTKIRWLVIVDFAGRHYDTFCGVIQYSNLYGTAVGYTIAASISMMWVSTYIIFKSQIVENLTMNFIFKSSWNSTFNRFDKIKGKFIDTFKKNYIQIDHFLHAN